MHWEDNISLMANAKPPIHYVSGLERIAEKGGISIPEASIQAIDDAIKFTAVRNKSQLLPEVITDIVAAAEELNPGILYTQGLRSLANSDEIFATATTLALTDATASGSTEHFEPIRAAFKFLTGKKY